ncbi:DUF4175 domain-containing protein [Pseudothauera rhizosphaerae]|uniref:DUF4175 domain-containing protein n=1 Tax=Pseudothauera rhizosphaerae TaxID=2565932 RepID=A0A4S4AFU7_9RHOO|nr:DUF4175 domain-containing protein [Pseudothauera rhizosphaerae]THF58084.1 DUF4175 domain-containing protein [Pseudothauera rhizosphaerae]
MQGAAVSAGQRSLSYEATPPFHVPLSFFLAAPLFGVAAGLYLLAQPEALASRWTPGALALTHLVTVGFMLLVMFGALMQVLPVVAGASVPAIRPVAAGVHGLASSGAIALASGLAAGRPVLLQAGGGLLGAAILLFLGAAAVGLHRSAASRVTGRDLRIALIGLAVTGALGIVLVLALSRGLAVPLVELANLHAGWGWLGWGGVLLAATSWVVVPMFQITPSYPAWLTRFWAPLVLAVLALWSALGLGGSAAGTRIGPWLLAPLALCFAAATLWLMRRTRRPHPDAGFRTLQLAMLSIAAGALCALAATSLEHGFWPVAAGVLVLHGGFVGAISAMLYKIVPFLAWLHLTQARVKAPNMKKLLPDAPMRRQLLLHAITLPALLAAASGHAWAGRIAGLLVTAEFGWLLANLAGTALRWRRVMGESGR